MGILKAILNAGNAEGIREAMRLSYRKGAKQAASGTLPSDFGPHVSGLLHAMGTRMAVNGQQVDHVVLWHEVAPFALIGDQEVAVEALAEYAVYVERTVDTKLAGLKETVNSWIRRAPDDHEMMAFLTKPFIEEFRWWGLLEPDVAERLRALRGNP